MAVEKYSPTTLSYSLEGTGAQYRESLAYLVACRTPTIEPDVSVPDVAHVQEFARAFTFIQEQTLTAAKENGTSLICEEYDVDGRLSMVIKTHETKKPTIALLVHIDTVAGNNELFTLRSDEENPDKVYGRGVWDMKGIAALLPTLVPYLPTQAEPVSFAALLASTEEKGGAKSAEYLRDLGYEPELIINPDGGGIHTFASGAKGTLFVSMEARGITAHGAYPHKGVNADNLSTYAKSELLKKYPEQVTPTSEATLTIGPSISTAGEITVVDFTQQPFNSIPSVSITKLDFRFAAPEQVRIFEEDLAKITQEITAKLHEQRSADSLPVQIPIGITTTVAARKQCMQIDTQHPWIQLFKQYREETLNHPIDFAVDAGTNDPAGYWNQTPTILTMPAGGGAHTPNEHLYLSGLHGLGYDLARFLSAVRLEAAQSSGSLDVPITIPRL